MALTRPSRIVDMYQSGVAVTPDDTATIATTLALWVGGSGALRVMFNGDTNPITISGVPSGLHRFAVTRVYLTGTTATSIVALR